MAEVFAGRVEDDCAWIGAELAARHDYVDHLEDGERAELAKAAALLPEDPNGWIGFLPEHIPLPTLGPRIDGIATQLEYGRGFALIRGLDPALSDAELKKQYWIIGSHLGRVVPQNRHGELMGSVTDKGSRYKEDVHARGYTSNDELVFHSDVGDAVALLCVRPARSGGENAIVSTMAIYNVVLDEAPHLLPMLYEGFPVYIRDDADGVGFGGNVTRQVSAVRYPVFSYYQGVLSGGINFKSIRAVPIVSGRPFSDQENEALDFVEAVTQRPEMRLDLRLDRGNILIVNNYMVLHKREKFDDFDDPAQKRLLKRLWINLHSARTLHPSLQLAMRGGYETVPVMELG
jgi:alpha-ketoglutarate-dependent taurine dioxygenase